MKKMTPKAGESLEESCQRAPGMGKLSPEYLEAARLSIALALSRGKVACQEAPVMTEQAQGNYFERHPRRVSSCRGDLGVALWESEPGHERETSKTTKEGSHEDSEEGK